MNNKTNQLILSNLNYLFGIKLNEITNEEIFRIIILLKKIKKIHYHHLILIIKCYPIMKYLKYLKFQMK